MQPPLSNRNGIRSLLHMARHRHARPFGIIGLLFLAFFATLAPTSPASQVHDARANGYDGNAAGNTAYNNAQYDQNNGIWEACTHLLVQALNAGGISTPNFDGNNSLVGWMRSNGLYNVVASSSSGVIPGNLQAGDLVFMNIDPPPAGDYWDHSVVITSSGLASYSLFVSGVPITQAVGDFDRNFFNRQVYNRNWVGFNYFLVVRPVIQTNDVTVTINGGPIDKTGNNAYFYPAQSGSTVSGGGSVYTYVNSYGRDNSIKYKPNLPQTACYDVQIYVPWILNNLYDSANVPVEVSSIHGVDELHKNYESFNNGLGSGPTSRWLDIGTYPFVANAGNNNQYVWISDNTGEAPPNSVNFSRAVVFDSVKFVYANPLSSCYTPPPDPTVTPSLTPTFTPTFTPTPTNTPTNTPPPVRIDSIGIYRNGAFLLRLHNSQGFADLSASFSAGTKSYPVVGDWTGGGFDSIGVFDQNTGNFSLRNTITSGAADEQFTLGNANDTPLSGRWSVGATHAGVGVYRPSNGVLYLKNALNTGFADNAMVMGLPGDKGIAGDWTGKGFDSPGIFRPGNATFFLSNQVTSGAVYADITATYGSSTDQPIVGDWTGLGHDGIGMFRPANGFVYLKNQINTGFADNSFFYGQAGDIPVAGHWQAVYPPIAPISAAPVLIPKTAIPQQGSISVPGSNQIGG